MAVSVAVCELFSVKARDLGNWVRSRSRSLKMAPFDRPYSTFYWSDIVYNYSSILYHFRVFWHRVISWPWNRGYRSLNVIETDAIRKLECGFLFAFYIVTVAVSVAVCEIFSVKERCDLENRVRVRSRSLEMAPFDRSHTSSVPVRLP